MSTVIYLANQQIQVITGTPGNRKISVADCYTEDAPDGCIINGMIMDAGGDAAHAGTAPDPQLRRLPEQHGAGAGWQHHQRYDYGCGCVCELHAELLDDT